MDIRHIEGGTVTTRTSAGVILSSNIVDHQ
jgi:hypothetical protein